MKTGKNIGVEDTPAGPISKIQGRQVKKTVVQQHSVKRLHDN